MFAGLTTAIVMVISVTTATSKAEATGVPQQQTQAAANGQTIGGMSCDAQEGQRIHIHQHLVVLDHGKPVAIPASIGIPAGKRCIYWVHTHTPDGIIHIEAPLDRSFTLGDFFMIGDSRSPAHKLPGRAPQRASRSKSGSTASPIAATPQRSRSSLTPTS